LGIGKGSVTLDDFNHAEVIIIMGQNPGTNHPRMLTALEKARKNGAQIVSINPLPETGLMAFRHPQHLKGMLGIGTPLTELFLPVRINGDMALLQALNKLLLEAEADAPGTVLDQAFIGCSTHGFEAYVHHLQHLNLEKLAASAGIAVTEIRKLADLLLNKKRIIVCWAMGLTQHRNAVATIREIVNLLLLKGSIGIKGGGTCPVRGHSNVQGDRTMGIYEKPSEAFLASIAQHFGFEPPAAPGYDVVESIHAMARGEIKVFMAMGGNFLSASPDTLYTATALANCRLTVNVATKLNRTHLVPGQESLILPCLGRSDRDISDGVEQVVSCENSMGVVQLSRGNLKPVSDQLLSEPAIICRMAVAVYGQSSAIRWTDFEKDYDRIRSAIAATIPGFEQYNERLRHPGGFYLPNCSREGRFDTPDQKAHFHVAQVEEIPLEPGELIMMTIRSHDQFNTTIYGLDDRYRGIFNERRVILMNAEDIDELELSAGSRVDLYSNFQGQERVARQFIVVSYPIPRGCTATYFPEANVLVPIHSVADKSNTPASKAVVIRVKKRDLQT
jgi:molybdopterin-dependent oxidoreductase alpha subunit